MVRGTGQVFDKCDEGHHKITRTKQRDSIHARLFILSFISWMEEPTDG